MKIAIIGNPGSGKSTLGRTLHKLLGIPLYHLDQYFWKPGWQRPDREEFKKIHRELCDKPEWVVEGMAARLLEYRAERADIIIFLDIPLYKCLYRVFKRAFMCFGTEREDSAQGCPERWPSFEFLRFIWNFNKKQKPIIKGLLEKYKHQKKIFVVKNKTELNELIQKFKSKTI